MARLGDAERPREATPRDALGHEAGLDRERAEAALREAGIAPERRPEELELDEWIALARAAGTPEG